MYELPLSKFPTADGLHSVVARRDQLCIDCVLGVLGMLPTARLLLLLFCRLLSFLQLSAFVLFSLFWVSLLDYMLFLLDCHWQDEVAPHHLLWEDQRE